ncbi:uncharacterized protein LOC130702724 isoform X2 [Daphnia carinata]|uniref:uncharacterized protein LOC130702724 isoform X2 n=1 Tax=Daphnia carinata TaxID=120202 RepID=UPI0025811409|nr:uncharacterized protein LOC130702724 isoform X2 [Daphnia carinata]
MPTSLLTETSRICSRHFDANDVVKGVTILNVFHPYKYWRLRDGAVPKHFLILDVTSRPPLQNILQETCNNLRKGLHCEPNGGTLKRKGAQIGGTNKKKTKTSKLQHNQRASTADSEMETLNLPQIDQLENVTATEEQSELTTGNSEVEMLSLPQMEQLENVTATEEQSELITGNSEVEMLSLPQMEQLENVTATEEQSELTTGNSEVEMLSLPQMEQLENVTATEEQSELTTGNGEVEMLSLPQMEQLENVTATEEQSELTTVDTLNRYGMEVYEGSQTNDGISAQHSQKPVENIVAILQEPCNEQESHPSVEEKLHYNSTAANGVMEVNEATIPITEKSTNAEFQTNFATYQSLSLMVKLPDDGHGWMWSYNSHNQTIFCTNPDMLPHGNMLVRTVQVLNGQKVLYYFNGKNISLNDLVETFSSIEELSKIILNVLVVKTRFH